MSPLKLAKMTGAVVLLTALAGPANAEIIAFEVSLSGENQVPPVATSGSGTLVAEFDTDTKRLSWTVTYENLSGPPTAAHFHGPAELGVNAGVAIGLPGDLASPITGEIVLTEEQAEILLSGLFYLNIHTGAFPAGEIRGQVVTGFE